MRTPEKHLIWTRYKMGKIHDLIHGKKKNTGKAILTVEAKSSRIKKVDSFVAKYGRGDVGLTEAQKLARTEKYINKPIEIEKVFSMGENKARGVLLCNKLDFNRTNKDEEHEGVYDPIPKELIENLEKYPRDLRAGKNKDGTDQDLRIVHIAVENNGGMEINHIHKDGKEADPKIRAMSGLVILDDYTSALNEAQQFKQGKLSEVSDRTMAIHKSEGVLDIFLEDDSVDTDEDRELQN